MDRIELLLSGMEGRLQMLEYEKLNNVKFDESLFSDLHLFIYKLYRCKCDLLRNKKIEEERITDLEKEHAILAQKIDSGFAIDVTNAEEVNVTL